MPPYSQSLKYFKIDKSIVCHFIHKRQSSVTSAKDCAVKPFSAIPGPRRLPLFGHLHLFSKFGPYSFEKLYDAYEDLYKLYGPVVRLDLGISIVALFRPEDIQKVLSLDGRYPNRPVFEALRLFRLKNKDIYSSAGLVGENGAEWKRLRDAINFMMAPRFAHQYLNVQDDIAHDFVNRIRSIRDSKRNIADFLQELYRFTEEAIGVVCFGTRLGLLNDNLTESSSQLSKASDETMQALADTLLGFPWWKFFSTPTYKKLARSQEFFHGFATKCAQQAADRLKDPNFNDSSLEFFRMLTEKNLKPVDISLLMTEIFSAGIDATGNAIGFLLYNLSRNPEAQEKLFNEIQHSLPRGQKVTPEIIDKMKYLNACVKESHRLTPTSGGTGRILNETTSIYGYCIPKDTLCIGLHPVLCRQPENFLNPLKYQPERWLDENGQRARNVAHPYCVLPFSHGVRRCIGQRFAEQEIRLCTIKVIQNFQLTYEGPEVKSKMRMLLIPDRPLNLTFTDRLEN